MLRLCCLLSLTIVACDGLTVSIACDSDDDGVGTGDECERVGLCARRVASDSVVGDGVEIVAIVDLDSVESNLCRGTRVHEHRLYDCVRDAAPVAAALVCEVVGVERGSELQSVCEAESR